MSRECLQQLFECANPVALVTGSGALRLGNRIACRLGSQGYRIVIHANRSVASAQQTADRLRQAGVETLCVAADLTNESAVKEMFQQVMSRFQRLDVLVNSAAIWKPIPLESVTADDVRRNLDANTLTTFVCSQLGGLQMVEQPTGGVIINLGDWAIARPYLNYAHYFPSKGAIPTLSRSLAVEFAARNPRVRVNAVLPGPVMLPPDLSPELRQQAIDQTLVKREGDPDHVASAVQFLIENDFVTGVCLPVDGGRTICP